MLLIAKRKVNMDAYEVTSHAVELNDPATAGQNSIFTAHCYMYQRTF